MIARSLFVIQFGILAALSQQMACCAADQSAKQMDSAKFSKYVRAGFKAKHSPYLFISWAGVLKGDRIESLLAKLPSRDYTHWDVDHSSDGSQLRFWNYDRTKAMVISKGIGEPRFLDTPPLAILDDRNEVVLWRGEDYFKPEIFFPNGTKLDAPAIAVDPTGKYLCIGGKYRDYTEKTWKSMPITIRLVSAPDIILATSTLHGSLSKVFTSGQRVYLLVGEGTKMPYPEGCEVYRQENRQLTLERKFQIRSPAWLSSHVDVRDFEPRDELFLLFVWRDLPLSSLRYLYDIKTGKYTRLGWECGRVWAFLDPHIFDGVLEAIGRKRTCAGDENGRK